MREELKQYAKLVDFLGNILGENMEVVLHETTDLNNSIVAISNSNVSGRKVGGPATDLVLKILHDPNYREKDYLCKYKGYIGDGKLVQSSTFFVRDNDGKIIGMFCVNTDIENITKAREVLDSLIKDDGWAEEEISEKLNLNAEELSFKFIDKFIADKGLSPEEMTQDDKIDIVRKLFDAGLFSLKGTVSQAAAALKVSEPSIYRYLSQIKRNKAYV